MAEPAWVSMGTEEEQKTNRTLLGEAIGFGAPALVLNSREATVGFIKAKQPATAAMTWEPYPLAAVDLRLPLKELLEQPLRRPLISRPVLEAQHLAIGNPSEFADTNYHEAPKLVQVVEKMVAMQGVSGEIAQQALNFEIAQSWSRFAGTSGLSADKANPASTGSSSRSDQPDSKTPATTKAGVTAKPVIIAGKKKDEGKKIFKPNRPDVTINKRGIPVAEFQDKVKLQAKAEGPKDPVWQLRQSLWLPHHSGLPWRLGVVKDQSSMVFYKMEKEEDNLIFKTTIKEDEGVKITFDNADSAWACLTVLVNAAAVVRELANLIPEHDSDEWLKNMRHVRNNHGNKTWVFPDRVHKYYQDAQTVSKLKKFYEETRGVPGLEQIYDEAEHVNWVATYESLRLGPIGIPANEYRHTAASLVQLGKQLKETLACLHQLRWVHLDIRASNVVLWEPGTSRQRWYLVDCEYALKLGELVPNKRYTGAYANQPAKAEHDYHQLQHMLKKLSARLPDDLSALNAFFATLALEEED